MSLLEHKDMIREDITIAINIWKECFLEKFPKEIEYIYAKGSALKPWDSNIDYVPQISDIDIQVKVNESKPSHFLYPTFETSINLSTEYQKRFEKVNKDDKRKYFHLPRLQIILINKIIKNLDTFVYPRLKDVYVLYGEPNFPAQLPFQEIQQIDLTNLKRLKETLEKIPIDLIDRTDPFEYYNLLRRMNYIISPSPVRVLTQVLLDENPYDIWAWNRTKIIQMLKKSALDELASSYKNYYLQCWDLYTSNFRDNELFLSVLSSGWKVLCQSYDIALIINK